MLLGIVVGVVIGMLEPKLGESLKPLGDIFVRLIKMLIGPIIFCTIVTGIGGVRDVKTNFLANF